MNYELIFKESYQRVLNRRTSEEKAFFDDFYDRFIASSPLVAERFSGVDMDAQKTMLKQSLIHLLNLSATKQIPDSLAEIARKHDRAHADIPAELYSSWMGCLLATVREADPKWGADVELAWRMVCAQGIAYMIYMHDKGRPAS